MIIKQLTKKVIVTSVMAGSLFVLPQVSPHHASAATVNISTTHQVLREGNVGRSVRAVQIKLNELGYYHDAIDGDYGPHTRSAVMGYQRAHHLVVDGIAGPNTLGKLFGTSSSVRTTTTTSSYSTWTASHSIATLQTRLRSLGYYHDSIDGINGPHTRSAIMAFQSRNGLAVNGIAGSSTWAKLDSSSARSASSSSVSTSSMSLRPISTNASSSIVDSIISNAKAEQGVPYRWGGATPSGFDCSGFTSFVFAKSGITLPRTSAQQYADGSPTNLVPGALVFFSTTSSGISHVGIYLGNNEFISATSSHGVAIESMNNSYWGPRYRGARTYINNQN